MANKHTKSRKNNYQPRAHDLVERPSPHTTSEGQRIGLFGDGIVSSETPRPETDLTRDSNIPNLNSGNPEKG